MLKGKKVASKTNTPTVEDSTSSEEDNPSVAIEEIQKSASPTTRSKSALKDSTPISSPTPSVPAEEIRKSTGPKARSKRSLEDSTSDSVPETSNTSPCTDTNKPYRSGFNAINEFANKYLEKDGDVRKKDHNKVWFTEFQLEKQKESPFWPILDVFVHKKAENKEEENSEKKKEKKRDLWFKSPESILKIVNQFRHDNSGNNVFVFNTAEEKKFVEVESMPEDLFLIFELKMVASEPVERECTKTRAEQRYGSLINRLKLKDQSKLGKLDVENEVLRIMKLNPKLDMEIERNAKDLYWFAEHNNNMTPRNEQGFPRFLRWVISDISNTIEKYIGEAMKKQKDEALEELSDLQVKHQKLVSFIEEKNKKIYAANLKNVQIDKDEEEEGEKGEKSGKGDVDDSDDDDDSDDNDEEEGDAGNRSGKDGDVDDSDKEQEEEGDEDEDE
ncbi:glutamic acid-rich protein-like [Papaver somniferum]|uniref:glutamic acid-rich protein-like n=1 Tax=Papaver somniferum TaxID=3469 RepID=UPI000E6F9547|nr:glutamic acid-rich protein-like [Papaver somniferum]